MKKEIKVSYTGLLFGTLLLAGPADNLSIGGTVSDSSTNKGTTVSIGGAKFAQKGTLSKTSATIGRTDAETDTGNVKIKSGRITNSVTNNSVNSDSTINIGTKVQKGSINMSKGSAGSIVNSSSNSGTIVSVGGGTMTLEKQDGLSSTEVNIGSTDTETNVGSINVDGGKVTNEISNAGMNNTSSVVNIGGVVNKGAIKVKGGQARSIENSSQNTATIVNIGGASFDIKGIGGLSDTSVKVGSLKTETDVGSVQLNSGVVKGDIQNTSTNNGTLVNVGSTLKVGTIEIGK